MALDLVVAEIKALRLDGVIVNSEHDSAWQADDRVWFTARPARSYRIRAAHADEPGIDGSWVLVKQIEPGKRVKMAAVWRGQHGNVDMMDELHRVSDVPSQDAYYDIVLGLIWQGFIERKYQAFSTILAQAQALQALTPALRQ